MFRSPTGQTGTDAYIYEAAQIANAQRELDARAKRLADAMADELTDEAAFKMGMPSEQNPDFFVQWTASDGGMQRFIRMHDTASEADMLRKVARGLANPNYVVQQSR